MCNKLILLSLAHNYVQDVIIVLASVSEHTYLVQLDAQSKPSEGSGDKVKESSPNDSASKEAADKPSSVSPEPMDTADNADKGPKLPARAPSPAASPQPAPKLPTAAPPPAVKPVKPARSGFDILNVFEEVKTCSLKSSRITMEIKLRGHFPLVYL